MSVLWSGLSHKPKPTPDTWARLWLEIRLERDGLLTGHKLFLAGLEQEKAERKLAEEWKPTFSHPKLHLWRLWLHGISRLAWLEF
jgi:hypothetical protein